jgi:transposase
MLVEGDRDDGLLAMSAKERERLVVVRAVGKGRLKQAAAAERLGVSLRQVKRLVRAWRGSGAAGLVSKRRGRPSARRIDEQSKHGWIDLIRQRHPDFGPTLACEQLAEHHAFAHSRETLRGWMIEAGPWKDKRVRHKRVFQLRARGSAVGDRARLGDDTAGQGTRRACGPDAAGSLGQGAATGRLRVASGIPLSAKSEGLLCRPARGSWSARNLARASTTSLRARCQRPTRARQEPVRAWFATALE